MITSTHRKTGRPKAWFKDRHGNRIEGLSRLKDGRWRASGPERFTFTEPSEDLAVSRFRAWEAKKQNGDAVRVGVDIDGDDLEAVLLKRSELEDLPAVSVEVPRSRFDTTMNVSRPMIEADVWAWVREQIVKRPRWVAERVGIEQIGYLADLPKPLPSPTLEEVGKLYLDRGKISPNWKAKAKLFWAEFCNSVDVVKLREITQEHIVDYGDMIFGASDSPSHSRQRFGAVKTIINFGPKRGKWAEDCKRVLAMCAVLIPPKKSATDPRPISTEDFKALYLVASPEMQAMLLLSLNCCMYGGEAAVVNWSDLDLDKAVLVSDRSKTRVVRVATLWPETVAALRRLTRRGDAIFRTEAGTQADYLCAYRLFKLVRKAAKLEQVQFSHLRDGAYTAAAEAGVDLNMCRLLAGHATGISDHYVKRRPGMVVAACDAIRAAYRIGDLV